jgi:hypothetical protein
MKKTVMAAFAAAMMVGMAQAAAIQWGVGTQQITDWNGTVQRGTTVELIFIGNTSGTAGEWVYETRTSTTQTTALGGKVSVGAISPGINIGNNVAGSGQNLISGESQFIVRIWNIDDTYWIDSAVFTYNAADDVTSVIWAAASVTTGGAVNNNLHSNWGTQGNWTAVPEPTSMALLALGAAALGLRRRFAK